MGLYVSDAVPQWNWHEVTVVPLGYQQQRLREAGREVLIELTRGKWIGWDEMKREAREIVLLGRCNRTIEGLEPLVERLRPGRVVPIHTEHAEHFAERLPNVVLLNDGEVCELLEGQ